MPDPAIANSSYLDFTAYRTTSATTVTEAFGLDPAKVQRAVDVPFIPFNVALTLERNADPAALLAQDWGTRQRTLAALNANGTLWSTYGAKPATFDADVAALHGRGLTVLDQSNAAERGNYVTSAESRTIWVEINTAQQFEDLFGTPLFTYVDPGHPQDGFTFWNGDLHAPESWQVDGLAIDPPVSFSIPPTNLSVGTLVDLPAGEQSIGNTPSVYLPALDPLGVAAYYNLPHVSNPIDARPLGLIAMVVGSALPAGDTESIGQHLAEYLAQLGVNNSPALYVQGEDGQHYDPYFAQERSVDLAVAAALDPASRIGLYTGSGANGNSVSSAFTAYQSAIWDTAHNPAVISSSFVPGDRSTPYSPFYRAYNELFVDAALRNQTLFMGAGDQGSDSGWVNGLANSFNDVTSPYVVAVGGTSLSTVKWAGDPPYGGGDHSTLEVLLDAALAGDRATIWGLVAGGLTHYPTSGSLQYFLETVWHDGYYDGTLTDYGATGGGVDTTRPTPSYQRDFGIAPVTADPTHESGRGVIDVSADAGGMLSYLLPSPDFSATGPFTGTSLSTPLWASLAHTIGVIFQDQGLPYPGYMNDLLYIAAAIAPASFQDVTLGNNTTSHYFGGPYPYASSYENIFPDDGVTITPTGLGYQAGPGYDLATGLGTPNGVVLARTLTDIAHTQMFFADEPAVIKRQGDGSWTSGADQTLILQSRSTSATAQFAWTSLLAEQSLQPDFDPALVTMFDRQAQGSLTEVNFAAGDAVRVMLGGAEAQAPRASLTSPFGFADFLSADGSQSLTVARPVMLATTAGGADDQSAIVRMRSNGRDSLSVLFYRVDDYNGTISGVAPGQDGYAAVAASRAYESTSGSPLINGPSYGNYGETRLSGVNAGDLIAMELVNSSHGTTYWEFAQANETVGGAAISHVLSYGLNTFGWEDTWGGGDRDYNDLIIGVDFTSASGRGLLA